MSVAGLGLPALMAQTSLIEQAAEPAKQATGSEKNDIAAAVVVKRGSVNARKLLHIVVSYNSEKKSNSKKVAAAFIAAYREKHKDVTITTRDVVKFPLQHLDEEGVSVEFLPDEKLTQELRAKKALRKTLIDEMLQVQSVTVR